MADYESIIPHGMNIAAFWSELKNFFISVEANREEVYADIKGVPTIGIGYALVQTVYRIKPGMSVVAEINVGKRRVIEFFLFPIIKYLDEGLKIR